MQTTLTTEKLAILRRVIPAQQMRCLRSLLYDGEEREFFVSAINEIAHQYAELPCVGADLPINKALARIHLFGPGCHWWIVEKSDDSSLVFGVADLGERELGYFDLSEIAQSPYVEIDLHWKPKTVQAILDEE
jgi:hypothetical protein